MTTKWDWEREYHIGRIDNALYIIDGEGNALEGPFPALSISHISFKQSAELIKGRGGEGKETLTKDGKEYNYPSNLTMNIKIGGQK